MSSCTKGIQISGTPRTIPKELFAVKSGDNSSYSGFCLCRRLAATNGQPQVLGPVGTTFSLVFASSHLSPRSSVKPGSPVLFPAPFCVPGCLDEDLENTLGAKMYLQALRAF